MDYLSKINAGEIVLHLSHDDARRLSKSPKMTDRQCEHWIEGLCLYIEAVYTGEMRTLEEIATAYNANTHRKFKRFDGQVRTYYWLLDDYLKFMWYMGNSLSPKAFNKFVSGYTEV